MSKDRFIAVLPISGMCRLAAFFRTRRLIEQRCYQALVSAMSSRAGKMASSNGTNRFVAVRPTKPLQKIVIATRRRLTSLQELRQRIRHQTISEQVSEINAVLRGHYAYYGVAGISGAS
ncbi:hypothetical protein [Bradyrhizobium sp.]|uniref:hypothetical protein n=1 Tax=Bradyrhizobium sp. TaxID=376 RepID=UPI003C70828D